LVEGQPQSQAIYLRADSLKRSFLTQTDRISTIMFCPQTRKGRSRHTPSPSCQNFLLKRTLLQSLDGYHPTHRHIMLSRALSKMVNTSVCIRRQWLKVSTDKFRALLQQAVKSVIEEDVDEIWHNGAIQLQQGWMHIFGSSILSCFFAF